MTNRSFILLVAIYLSSASFLVEAKEVTLRAGCDTCIDKVAKRCHFKLEQDGLVLSERAFDPATFSFELTCDRSVSLMRQLNSSVFAIPDDAQAPYSFERIITECSGGIDAVTNRYAITIGATLAMIVSEGEQVVIGNKVASERIFYDNPVPQIVQDPGIIQAFCTEVTSFLSDLQRHGMP